MEFHNNSHSFLNINVNEVAHHIKYNRYFHHTKLPTLAPKNALNSTENIPYIAKCIANVTNVTKRDMPHPNSNALEY